MKVTKRLKFILVTVVMTFTLFAGSVINANATDTKTGQVYGINSGSYLNVRSKASTSASIIDKLYNNDVVTILGTDGNFYKISFVSGNDTVTGYASKDYIKIITTTTGSTDDSKDDESSNDNNTDYTPDVDFEEYLDKQGFPESYKEQLRELHKLHPEWIFTAQHTNLDWNTVLSNEMVLGRSLINKSSPESWRSMDKGAYNFTGGYYIGLDGSSWFAASEGIVKYYLDPRNFLNEDYILMFENLSYNSSVHTEENVKKILKNSFMKGEYVTPDTSETYTYSKTFMDAAKKSGVSPYHLATRALQEQGTSGSSLATGTVSKYPGYFNFFNIQAFTSSSATAVENGAKYASTTNEKYLLPWTNQYKAIVGGSIWIGTGYINKSQDTLYLQKFDVIDGGNGYYVHQYMTNIQAAESEAKIMKRAYPDELFNSALEFKIPIYKNMPETACTKPSTSGNNNNYLDSLTVDGQTISPTFDRYKNTYTLSVDGDTSTINIKAVANNSKATISGAGKVSLKTGENKIVIAVKSTSGLTRNYTLTVTKPESTTSPSEGEIIKGDVTGDGKVTIKDSLTIVRYVNGYITLDETQLKTADVTGDGKVTIKDALTIVRFVNGYIKEL